MRHKRSSHSKPRRSKTDSLNSLPQKDKLGKRRPWTPKEDDAIQRLVHENGTKQWTVISEKLNQLFSFPGRTGKQCRERWHNHLNPGINKDDWSLEEELILFENHEGLGNKWAEISKFLPGRTDNSIKNHFYSTLRKQYRRLKGSDGTREQLRKHDKQLTMSILAALHKKNRQKRANSFAKAKEEFYGNDENMIESPPSLPDLPLEETDFIITGHQIPLPPPVSPVYFEEAPVEFVWTDDPFISDEVFLMPYNSQDELFM
ncbi:unnamed protein product [Blepharisma stoltei]|uniref:Myb-like DNA-binding domain containing protein n=1 Tax=Blepharisma stoltei TaxID=1481888 RepID=A0AAU9JU43_9CILI|nr:unnamed protein product [Blepharisma stoltei]